jgi:predicted TPR repeat methyltransferase
MTAVLAAEAPFVTRLEQAIGLLREENLPAADAAFAALMAEAPDHPDCLLFTGILRHVQGRSDEGIALMRGGIEAAPARPGPWNNLGNVLLECERFDEAVVAYEKSVELSGQDPSAADSLVNLGVLHRRRLRFDQAERCIRRALDLRPEYAEGWYNLAGVLIEQGRVHEGLLANGRAITLWPRNTIGRDQVIRALNLLGEHDKALALYREWAAEEPDNPIVQHQMAACAGGAVPERASDAYVTQVFDAFAQTFDAKLGSLGYRAPQLVADALREAAGEPAGEFTVADVGCGTGLVGPLVRLWARKLVGCDLSVGMLRRARARKIYDGLHKAELVHYLDTQPGHFDVVLSADTLCYFGALESVLAAAHKALRPGGCFIFSVEALPDDAAEPHAIRPSGRYAHSRRYIERAAVAAGFVPVAALGEVLRNETGLPVQGWVVTLGRPHPSTSE